MPAHMRSIGVGAESGWTADSVPLTPSLSASGILYGATLSPATPGCNPPGIGGCGPWICCHAHWVCPPAPPPRATRSSSWCWHDDCAGRPRVVTARLKTWVTNWLTSKNFSPPWLQKLAQILSLFPFSTAFPSSRTPPPWTKEAFWSKLLWWAPSPVNHLHALCLVNGTGPQWSREGLANAKGPFRALSPCMPSSPRFIFLFKKLHFVYLFLAFYFVLGYSQWTMW